MSVDMRNSEGYLDLTAYEAIKKVDQEQRSGRAFRPIVYICSPYAGDIAGNVDAARRYSRFAVDKGYIPIAPHLLYPQFLDDADPDERELGIFFGNAIMSKKGCDISAIVNPWVSPLTNSAKIHTKPCAGLRLKRAQRFDHPLPMGKSIYILKSWP